MGPLTRATKLMDRLSMAATVRTFELVGESIAANDWRWLLAAVVCWLASLILVPVWLALSLVTVAVWCLFGLGRVVRRLFQ